MHKFLLAGVALLALGAATPALAQASLSTETIAEIDEGSSNLDRAAIRLSPAVPRGVVSYVRANPSDDVVFYGRMGEGDMFDGQLTNVPDNMSYGYAYVQGRPLLVERSTGLIVWVG